MEPQLGKPARRIISIARSEWRDVFVVAALLLAITSLPYATAYASVPADRVFMGVALNVPDHAQYFSWLRSHADSVFIKNRMTPEPNDAVFFNLLWWTLANASHWIGIEYSVTYQLLRILGVCAFLAVAYRLIAVVFDDRRRRRFALLLMCVSSGLGWTLVIAKYTIAQGELWNPLDVYVAEGNTFLSALGYPHFLAAAAYIFCFEQFLRALHDSHVVRRMIGCGLFAQFMGWQHAYDLIIVWGVLAAFTVFYALRSDRNAARRAVLGLAVIMAVSSPPALYAFALTRWDPLWNAVLAQFDNAGVWTPPPWRLPMLFGFTFIVACIMAWRDARLRWKSLSDAHLLVWVWFVASFILIYLPTDFQIHMLNGWQAPMAILATRWVYQHAAPRLQRMRADLRPRLVALAFLAVVAPTNVYLLGWRIVDLARHRYDYTLRRADVAGLRWLGQHAGPDDVIFSSLTIGQFVPTFTDAHAYLAHWAQTVNFFARRDAVRQFFSGELGRAARTHILIADSVDYIFVGSAERSIPGFDPSVTDGMRVVFADEEVRIYATDH